MTLREMVYATIFHGKRISCYKTYDEYWYVILWHTRTYIHYSFKLGHGQAKILWFLSNSVLCPKWKCQTNELIVEGTTPKSMPPESESMP